MTIRNRLLSGAAAAALLLSAMAGTADAENRFDGFYFGAAIGGGHADYNGFQDPTDSSEAVFANDLDLGGVVGAFHGGFAYQMESMFGEGTDMVLGVEGNVTLGDFKDKTCNTSDSSNCLTGDVDLLASVRGVLGIVPHDNLLLYVTAGAAFADATWIAASSTAASSVDFNDVGAVVGGGAEFAVTEFLSVRGEMLYYIFDDRRNTSSLPGGASGDYGEFDHAFIAKLGLTVHLNGLVNGPGG